MRRQFSGATISRLIDRSDARVPEHAHDWPVLSLFVLGRYLNQTDLGVVSIDGPSAIFYRAGAAHCNAVGPDGFEQIEIEFDPDWIGAPSMPEVPVSRWIGGISGAAARVLARSCSVETDANRLRDAVRRYLQIAGSEPEHIAPSWIGPVRRRLRENTTLGVDALAREVGRHPSYLGAAYQAHIGEGPMETAARNRVERAARALRETAASCAAIAVEAGFYDQSI